MTGRLGEKDFRPTVLCRSRVPFYHPFRQPPGHFRVLDWIRQILEDRLLGRLIWIGIQELQNGLPGATIHVHQDWPQRVGVVELTEVVETDYRDGRVDTGESDLDRSGFCAMVSHIVFPSCL
jgi:hypothetical protein